jgi:ABC-type hemin transport system substrate-binding protein
VIGPGWRQLDAVRCNRIVTVDRALLNRPGPRMGEAAAALRAALQSVPRGSCAG